MNPKETYRWQVQLSAEQRRELQNARDHHPKSYVRERSAARLQMAEGKSPHWVATHGVLNSIVKNHQIVHMYKHSLNRVK